MEDLIIIKENNSRIEAFKAKGKYELKRLGKILFRTLTVDDVISVLTEETKNNRMDLMYSTIKL